MLKNKNRIKKNLSSNTIATISSIVILLGLLIFFNNYLCNKKQIAYDYMNNIFYDNDSSEGQIKNENNNEDNSSLENSNSNTDNIKNINNSYNYIGYLEIPKISLRKGFVKKEDKNNNVEKNIFIVDKSDYPDKPKGNFIVAAHSGSGWKAFFNDLYKLNIGDYVYVEYDKKKYIYKIDNIYKQKKTGTIAIYRDYSKKTLTLITCTNNDDTTQTIYIAYPEKNE